MNISATGTTGLIGSELQEVNPLNIDLKNPKTWGKIEIPNNSTIIHLAGIVGERNVLLDEKESFEVNVVNTIEFASFVNKQYGARFLFVSSSHVYKPSIFKHMEEDVCDPINMYGSQKHAAEKGLLELFNDRRECLCIARVFSVLGPRMPRGTLGWAAERISDSSSLKNCDDERDFLTPKEIANYLLLIAKLEFSFDVINICSGVTKKVGAACMEYRQTLGLETLPEWLEAGNSSIPCILGDNTKLRSLIRI